MNSKPWTKWGYTGCLLASTQRGFIRLVMVVQFHQITAKISSVLRNEMNCDSTSRSPLLSAQRSPARSWRVRSSQGHFITSYSKEQKWWRQSYGSSLTLGSKSEGRCNALPDMQRAALQLGEERGIDAGNESTCAYTFPLHISHICTITDNLRR